MSKKSKAYTKISLPGSKSSVDLQSKEGMNTIKIYQTMLNWTNIKKNKEIKDVLWNILEQLIKEKAVSLSWDPTCGYAMIVNSDVLKNEDVSLYGGSDEQKEEEEESRFPKMPTAATAAKGLGVIATAGTAYKHYNRDDPDATLGNTIGDIFVGISSTITKLIQKLFMLIGSVIGFTINSISELTAYILSQIIDALVQILHISQNELRDTGFTNLSIGWQVLALVGLYFVGRFIFEHIQICMERNVTRGLRTGLYSGLGVGVGTYLVSDMRMGLYTGLGVGTVSGVLAAINDGYRERGLGRSAESEELDEIGNRTGYRRQENIADTNRAREIIQRRMERENRFRRTVGFPSYPFVRPNTPQYAITDIDE